MLFLPKVLDCERACARENKRVHTTSVLCAHVQTNAGRERERERERENVLFMCMRKQAGVCARVCVCVCVSKHTYHPYTCIIHTRIHIHSHTYIYTLQQVGCGQDDRRWSPRDGGQDPRPHYGCLGARVSPEPYLNSSLWMFGSTRKPHLNSKPKPKL